MDINHVFLSSLIVFKVHSYAPSYLLIKSLMRWELLASLSVQQTGLASGRSRSKGVSELKMNSGSWNTKEGTCSIRAQRDQKLSVTNLSTSKLILGHESPDSFFFFFLDTKLSFKISRPFLTTYTPTHTSKTGRCKGVAIGDREPAQ